MPRSRSSTADPIVVIDSSEIREGKIDELEKALTGLKGVASFGGSVDELVPEPVARRCQEMSPRPKAGAPVSPRE